jgi:hypothetical protein
MARNYKKNRNITMPLARESEVLQALLADAEDCNMLHQIGVFAALRLAEYYKARRQGRILPEGVGYAPPYLPAQTWGAPGAMLQNVPPSGNGYQRAPSNGPNVAELERLKSRPEIIQADQTSDLDADDLAFFTQDEEEEE